MQSFCRIEILQDVFTAFFPIYTSMLLEIIRHFWSDHGIQIIDKNFPFAFNN